MDTRWSTRAGVQMQICQDLAQEPWNLEMRSSLSALSQRCLHLRRQSSLQFLTINLGYTRVSSLHSARLDDEPRKDVTYPLGTWALSSVR
jgi:hypothetical protein